MANSIIVAFVGAISSLIVAYLTYQGGLKDNDVDAWKLYQHAQKELDDVREERRQLRNKVDDLKEKIKELKRTIQNLKEKIEELKKIIQNLKENNK